jgi:60 kDa SS-A/Ro ribonucleoprotein
MGQTAIIRNLAKMTAVGLLKPMSNATNAVAAILTDTTKLFSGRIHPITVLLALKTYQSGHGLKGSLTWAPVREIVDALDEAFYLSFQAIEPSGKRTMLALDVSGSMSSHIAGTSLSAREACAAMAMATARTEKHWLCMGFSNRFIQLDISPKQRLDDVVKKISNLPFENTDCGLPMLFALENKLNIDIFSVWTDSETYAGRIQPFQALRKYREVTGIPAKLAVCATTATDFTIADPSDAGMLDVCGFDASVPAVLADFTSNREVVS